MLGLLALMLAPVVLALLLSGTWRVRDLGNAARA
jgi:hypothetical protein